MPLQPFVDALPIPKVLKPMERSKSYTYYEVKMQEFYHQFHSELGQTKVWGYEGQLPGPTIEVEEGECTHIKWMNNLPDEHLLTVDQTIHGASEHVPEVRTVVHLHGSEVEPESDGYPDAWFTKDFGKCGPRFVHKIYKYANNQRPTALWYHDHALGITRLNVYAGLAGMYIIRNEQERALNLPSGIYEIPLIIQDKRFNNDSSLFYPASITPGFAGDTIIVNGKAWPYLEVEQRKYRFRILNASNGRFYRMKLDSGQQFIQIGSDGGLLQRPVQLDEITIAPSERIDVVIDFTNLPEGASVILTNTAVAASDPTANIMLFSVKARNPNVEDDSTVPNFLSKIKRFDECDVSRTRDITINVTRDNLNRLLFLLNNHEYMDGINEQPIAGDLEMWRIINQGLAVHPIHIHQIQFQIMDRIPFDAPTFVLTGQLRFTGEPELPPANERGWKDTVQATPGFVTRLAMRFGPYYGRYVYHCHILEHEDHDMMRPFDVVPRKCVPVKTDRCPNCSEVSSCVCEE